MLKMSIKKADIGWKNAPEESYSQIIMQILSFLHVFVVLLPVTAFRDLFKNRYIRPWNQLFGGKERTFSNILQNCITVLQADIDSVFLYYKLILLLYYCITSWSCFCLTVLQADIASVLLYYKLILLLYYCIRS
jgi:hypothetical protein